MEDPISFEAMLKPMDLVDLCEATHGKLFDKFIFQINERLYKVINGGSFNVILCSTDEPRRVIRLPRMKCQLRTENPVRTERIMSKALKDAAHVRVDVADIILMLTDRESRSIVSCRASLLFMDYVELARVNWIDTLIALFAYLNMDGRVVLDGFGRGNVAKMCTGEVLVMDPNYSTTYASRGRSRRISDASTKIVNEYPEEYTLEEYFYGFVDIRGLLCFLFNCICLNNLSLAEGEVMCGEVRLDQAGLWVRCRLADDERVAVTTTMTACNFITEKVHGVGFLISDYGSITEGLEVVSRTIDERAPDVKGKAEVLLFWYKAIAAHHGPLLTSSMAAGGGSSSSSELTSVMAAGGGGSSSEFTASMAAGDGGSSSSTIRLEEGCSSHRSCGLV